MGNQLSCRAQIIHICALSLIFTMQNPRRRSPKRQATGGGGTVNRILVMRSPEHPITAFAAARTIKMDTNPKFTLVQSL